MIFAAPLFRLLPVCCLLFCCACKQKKNICAVIHTDMGDVQVRLYDDTPRHRNFFVKSAQSGTYDSLFVHRIERDFIIQSGLSHSTTTMPYPAPALKHPLLRGALATNGFLFFIVQGRPQTDESLDKWEKQLGKPFSAELRALYKHKGGAPQLDGKHTVFGEVTSGLDVVDRIAALPRDADDRPLREIRMWVEIQ